ncbi:moronecidin-like isoform X1 [Poecilia formosa]|uniref:moronecidin-like isoform X1 n=1 Tax=Poecilia formosa TaxID=48698 RepID=UPI0007BADC6A|nr:PREDICTED: moronecidin-like isoform X1 [Poecilia formosa]XP_016518673.1 PREDICTED: moronecidin-like isoform X1 [Poecilia formosa]
MKCVMIFLVLSLVVLMAEPGEGFLRSVWRAGKSMFRGARQGFREYRHQRRLEKIERYRQKYEKEPEEPERHRYA